ncbi:hypothetical protein K2173_020961 [Erythroxylum novogranatense]|uniref:Methyltransferase type 11 domain-containing protein n=1 Tax=Erythroxylum novogranatense TaxID=1862640 RepID=A0AAV8TMA2_9ROSI|nr:hypothetical protein K2173_020961 [Erythroxylum novogranatense]
MADTFGRVAEVYMEGRPSYPSEWFSWLAALTNHHSLAWDVGTGNGQAALGVAEHYKQVIATDTSEEQLKHANPHPKVRYLHTPLSMSDDQLVGLVGSENSVDLITVAVAVHWFDLQRFYGLVNRLLKKPGGVIALWTYYPIQVSPEVDIIVRHFYERGLPYLSRQGLCSFEGYKALPFPFESIGSGLEGQPLELDMPKDMSCRGFLGYLRSWPQVQTAAEGGVELLPEETVAEIESAWGGSELVRTVIYKSFMLIGKVKQ